MTDAAWWAGELLVACAIASWLCWRQPGEHLMADERPLLERAMEWVRDHMGPVASWYSRDRARAAWIAGYKAREGDEAAKTERQRKAQSKKGR